MFRKSLLGVAVAALALGTASVASAQPFPQFPQPQPFPQLPPPQPQPFPQQPQPFPRLPIPQPDRHYHVMYRTCDHVPWRTYGTFDCHDQAHDIERMLRRRGFEARVVHH
jgi:hypothetical protein